MVVYEKIYFKTYTNDQYIWHRNNIHTITFYIGESRDTSKLFEYA